MHTIITALLATAEQKTAMVNDIWSQHLVWQDRQIKINAYVGNLEALAKANLEAREEWLI